MVCKWGITEIEMGTYKDLLGINTIRKHILQTTTYLESVCPLFWWLNPPKQGLFQSKQGSFGFQVGLLHSQHPTSARFTIRPCKRPSGKPWAPPNDAHETCTCHLAWRALNSQAPHECYISIVLVAWFTMRDSCILFINNISYVCSYINIM